MGAERRSMVMSDKEKRLTAYHESGHAIVGLVLIIQGFEHDPVYKVTIIPRGRALGVTMFLPEEDRYSYTKQRIEAQMTAMYGGRVAEEIIFGEDQITTGASNDIEKATELARNMVTKWGLSEKLGPLTYGENESEVFLGRSVTQRKELSDTTANAVDAEVRIIVDRNYARAQKILQDNIDKLHLMADALIKYETIGEQQLKEIMAGKPASAPAGWDEKPPVAPTATAPDNNKPVAGNMGEMAEKPA
jgi:cell division protease FtsH